ncbi:MAG TPA: 7-cyano-7-deazaguanine synthase QueC [Ktedonobacterales bacterium]|jgi:7-cyano-7-deazaguanine synthase|nr:7-cyano-7-deazaguanine synthase QueC [Ktedonobacterales bacterium]
MTSQHAIDRTEKRAIVLLSGGLDSSTALAIAVEQGYAPYALSFRYGQRHERELEAAQAVGRHFGCIEHKVIDLDLSVFGGSALIDDAIALPLDRDEATLASGVPVTYVPARNLIFLSIATAYAEVTGADDIFLGITAVDYSGYPDCRPEFLDAFAEAARLATKAGTEDGRVMRFHAPLIALSKADIVREGTRLGVPWKLTWSCYAGGKEACGRCDSCQLRLMGFADAGLSDPLPYAHSPAGQ